MEHVARPFDPRLIRYVPSTRAGLLQLGVLGVATAATVVVAAAALARALAAAVELRLDQPALAVFLLALAARAGLTSALGIVAARMSATVKASLRGDLLGAVGRR